MRYFLLCLLAALPGLASAQDILKMIDGTEKPVKLIEVQDTKVLYYELGDPLSLEHDMPKSRVTKIIHEDGVVEALRKDPPKQGLVIVRQTKPDSTREAVILKTSEEIPAKILAVEPTAVVIKRRTGPKMGYQERIRREAIAKLRYADGSERDIAQEEGESVRTTGRRLFDFDDEAGPDRFFRHHFVTQAARSRGRLFTPDELLSFKRYADLKEAAENRADVRFLDLHGRGLSTVPHDVLLMRRLVGLDLSNNPLTSFPDELLTMPNLQYLWVDSCQLGELKPKFDNKQKSNLIYLSARGNRIGELNPAVGALPSLYVLCLEGNRIHKVKGKGLFASGPDVSSTLAVVDLAENGLDELPEGLSAFPQMRYLGCRGNRISVATGKEGDLARLTHLDLSRNPLPKLDPGLLALPMLRELRLDETNITQLPAQGWAQATRLEALSLPAVPLPGEIWRAPSLHELKVLGKPAPDATPILIPALLPDSLDDADLTGVPGGAALALALKARRPGMRVRYYQPLMGKVQQSDPGGPAELAEFAKVRAGEADPAIRLAQALAKRGDYGLAVTALAGGSSADTSASDRLRLEQARLLAQPDVQPYLTEDRAVRDYTGVSDVQAHLPTCQSLRMLRSLCLSSSGAAAQAPCREAAALLRRAAASLEKLAAEGNAKKAPDLRAEAARLTAEAEALEKR